MPGWFRDAPLAPGEQLLFRRAANLRRGRRSIGGEVSVTDQRVLFVPNQLEHLVRVRTVEISRAAVVAATVLRAGTRSPIGPGRGRAEIVTAETTWPLNLADPEVLVELLAP